MHDRNVKVKVKVKVKVMRPGQLENLRYEKSTVSPTRG